MFTISTIALFKERETSDFQPFMMASDLVSIENCMWEHSCRTTIFRDSLMRDRCQYLIMLNGVLRMESLYLGDSSDLCNFIFHQKQERDSY